MTLRSLLLTPVLLLIAGPALATSFTVHDYTLGWQVSYELDGESNRSWTAAFDVSLDDVMGTSFCIDLEQHIGRGSYSVDAIHAPDELANPGYVAAAIIASEWANSLEELAVSLGVGLRDAITGVQVAIWQRIYGDRLVVDLARLGAEHVDSLRVLERVEGGAGTSFGAEQIVYFRAHQDQVFSPSVPEPSAALAFSLGLLVLGARRPRRRPC